MSTRSTIAVLNPDGTVSQVYCHFDGYLSGVGVELFENYTDFDSVKELVELGDMSALGSDVYSTIYYGRDRNETGTEPYVFKSYEDYKTSKGSWNDYNYYFDSLQWFYKKWDDGEWKSLAEALMN